MEGFALMGARVLKIAFTHLTHASINFSDLLAAEVRSRNVHLPKISSMNMDN
jgi:hypothetical protein